MQNLDVFFPTEAKSALIDAIARADVREIDAGSFVPPKVVPQFADVDAVMTHALTRKTTTIGALVPNPKGAERATAAAVNRRSPSSIKGSPWPVYDLFDTNEARSLSLPIVGDEQWDAFCHAFDREVWLQDSCFVERPLCATSSQSEVDITKIPRRKRNFRFTATSEQRA
ncbi:hypothetical protein ACVWZV_007008 [Bradyrhizobium sp. GM5.1]